MIPNQTTTFLNIRLGKSCAYTYSQGIKKMRVIIYAQDLSGRRDDGFYTKPDAASALEIFFDSKSVDIFSDPDGEEPLDRESAELLLEQDRSVKFYNGAGEQVIISYDPSA